MPFLSILFSGQIHICPEMLLEMGRAYKKTVNRDFLWSYKGDHMEAVVLLSVQLSLFSSCLVRIWFPSLYRCGNLTVELSLSGGGHSKAFDYPVMDHWGNVKVLRDKADLNRRPVGPQSSTPTTRPPCPSQVGGSNIPRVLNGEGDLLPIGGRGVVCENSRV